MKKMILTLAVVTMFSIIWVLPAWAGSDILVEAVTLNVVPSGKMASAFMVITNQGAADDRLVSCSVKEAPTARCEVHNVAEGKMFPVEGVDIEAGKTLLLKKGSYHLMVMDIAEPLSEQATVVLNFNKAGAIEAPATVKMAEGAMGSMMKPSH